MSAQNADIPTGPGGLLAPPGPPGRTPVLPAALLAALPLLCLGAVFLLQWRLGVFVRGDSFQAYSMFRSTLGNLLTAREFPQWLPLAAFGSPAEPYAMTFLGVWQLLALLAGAALRVADAWTLFLLSTLAESAVLVLGAQLLSRELHRCEATAAAVGAWVAVSVYWSGQIFWSHRLLVHAPLMLLFGLRFHRTGDVRELLRAGLAALLSLVGGVAYAAPMYALLGAAYLVALRLLDRAGGFVRLARPGLPALAEGVLLAALAGLYAFLFFGAFDGVVVTAPGRDPATGAVSLEVFLRHGGSALAVLPEFVTGTWWTYMEHLFYLGAPCTGLLAYALWRERGGVFLALAAVCGLTLLLALGPHGLVAYAAYRLPGMDHFRHLSMLLPLLRLLLFFLAGYGLARLLRAEGRERDRAFACLLGAGVVMLGLKRLTLLGDAARGPAGLATELGLCLLLLARLATRRKAAAAAGMAVALAGLLDVGWAQHFLLRDMGAFFPPEQVRDVAGVDAARTAPPRFFAGRAGALAENPNAQALRDFALRQPVNNFTLLEMAGADPCVPVCRIDYATPGVLALLERAEPGGLAATNVQYDPRVLLDGLPWRGALAQQWYREAVGWRGGKLVFEAADGTRSDVSAGVRHFSANRLVLALDAGEQGGTVHYADAWHPGWRAAVDGRLAPVAVSRGAFKAVPLPPGGHLLAFSFFDPRREWARRGLALLGALALAQLFACALGPAQRSGGGAAL